METVHTTLRAYLEEKGEMTYRIRGASMLPMLRQNRDLVTLRRYDGEGLRKYDVAMYDRGGERRYVLHRVVGVHDGCYTFLGDNCGEKEYPIPEQAVVAVMTSFYRGNRLIPVASRSYRLYSRLWYLLYPPRRAWKRLRARLASVGWLKRLYHRIKNRT